MSQIQSYIWVALKIFIHFFYKIFRWLAPCLHGTFFSNYCGASLQPFGQTKLVAAIEHRITSNPETAVVKFPTTTKRRTVFVFADVLYFQHAA
mmetsp:Transcript_43905/g.92388  ORF Transcript_43905/g.92388 Transcript_43905/m.92388 type:complete len:93 (+) Transcript_43905:1704-1982(+)